MSYIAAEEYTEITGEDLPQDFSTLAPLADKAVDRVTLYGLWGRDIKALPAAIRGSIQQAAAYQVQFLSQSGGLSAVNEASAGAVTLGKFSYSGAAPDAVSPLLDNTLAVVTAYLRGLVE